jgi:putative flavoprotein involved in K+ transport
MASEGSVRRIDTVVIGGGQAGLVVAHGLSRNEVDYVVLDAAERIGDAWRNRWDSLRLFTQARMNGLPGMPFPGPGGEFVGKDRVADYLEAYASEMGLSVRSGVRVVRLSRDGDGYLVETTDGVYSARNVIVAMADYQTAKVPPFASQLDPDIVQMHSSAYKRPGQLRDGNVLVVGLGNSGADIAYEVAKTHDTIVSGREKGGIPFALEGWFGRHLGTRLVRAAMVRVLNTSTPMGRQARRRMLESGPPLVRVRAKELRQAGVQRVGRTISVEEGMPVTEDGGRVEVANVIWCTGFSRGFGWIDLPIFDDEGRPIHTRGVVESQPGLYFLGLFFLHSAWSETITGVQPDARHVLAHIMGNRVSTTPRQGLSAERV